MSKCAPRTDRVIGINIEALQRLASEPLIPPPNWIRSWQLRAEHVVAMAHFAKDRMDLDELRKLDAEAERLIDERTRKQSVP